MTNNANATSLATTITTAPTRSRSPLEQSLSTKHRQQLITTRRLLHLTIHRNKNQHRRAKWWKWLAVLHKSVGKLLVLLRADGERGLDDARFAGSGKATENEEDNLKRWDEMVVHLRERIVPRCFRYVWNFWLRLGLGLSDLLCVV